LGNVSRRFREGWTPVLAKDYPELKVLSDVGSRFPENIEIGGLMLCATDTEIVDSRRQYIAEKTEREMRGVDEHFLSQSDPRMPVLRPDVQTRHTTQPE
jgi:hypothetical protein